MEINYSFSVLSEKHRQIEIKYHNKSLRFQLKVKRSFTILKAMLKEFPEYLNIHSLDKILNDPNRAYSSLKNEDGFSEYLSEKRGEQNVMFAKIEISKLFDAFQNTKSDTFISLVGTDLRKLLTDEIKDKIYSDFNGICNITKIKLYKKLPLKYFFKRGLEATYDHRIPLCKGGNDKIENIQLISVFANSEKNKICNSCNFNKCKHCALTFPETNNIIQMNGQDISVFKK